MIKSTKNELLKLQIGTFSNYQIRLFKFLICNKIKYNTIVSHYDNFKHISANKVLFSFKLQFFLSYFTYIFIGLFF